MTSGNWINSYSPGIWLVHRVVPIGHEMRFSLTDRRKKSKRVMVFSRRIVDDKWHPAFKTECCEQSLVALLAADDKERLDHLLNQNVELKAAFGRYAPEPCPFFVNLSMRIPNFGMLESFCSDILTKSMALGLCMEEVLKLLESAGLSQFIAKYPINATLQMVGRDHEIQNGEFLFHDFHVLPF